MEKNDLLTLTVEDVNEMGDGIGRTPDGFVVFCRGMLPGETAEVRIIKKNVSYAVARMESLLTPSPDRVPACCSVFTRGCGGCAFCHLSYAGQLAMKAKRVRDCLTRLGGLQLAVPVSDIVPEGPVAPQDTAVPEGPAAPGRPFAGRNKSVYAFTVCDGGAVRCGFYARNSHRVVPLADDTPCRIEGPSMPEIRKEICALATRFSYSVYNETTGKGLLRHLILRRSAHDGTVMAVLVLTQKFLPQEAAFLEALTAACPNLVSVYINVNAQPTNVILGRTLRLLYGEEFLTDAVGPACYRISPTAFYQVNPVQTEKLYDAVYRCADLQGGEKILDLYCGSGTIGLYLLQRFAQSSPAAAPVLAGIEQNEQAVADAKENARLNGLSNCVFLAADAQEGADYLFDNGFRPDTVIVDPPRKGCDGALLQTVLQMAPSKLIYVSCNPATLARDLAILTCGDGGDGDDGGNDGDGGGGRGRYGITCVQPIDMFPMTGHVETVVCLSRRKQK